MMKSSGLQPGDCQRLREQASMAIYDPEDCPAARARMIRAHRGSCTQCKQVEPSGFVEPAESIVFADRHEAALQTT